MALRPAPARTATGTSRSWLIRALYLLAFCVVAAPAHAGDHPPVLPCGADDLVLPEPTGTPLASERSARHVALHDTGRSAELPDSAVEHETLAAPLPRQRTALAGPAAVALYDRALGFNATAPPD